VAGQILQQVVQTEPPIEAIAESPEVLVGVLAELEGLVAAVDQGLEVSQHGVDPSELRHLARQPGSHNDVGVRTSGIDYPGKAAQAVAAHVGAGLEVLLGPTRDGLAGEPCHPAELDAQGVACVVGLNRSGDRNLVGRATAPNARALSPKVRVIDLNRTVQGQLAVALRHRRHQLLVDQPRRAIGRAQVPLQGQRRQPSLVLAQEVDGQEPGGHRQLGAVQHRASGQRGLTTTSLALVQLAGALAEQIVLGGSTSRAAKACRPAHRRQRRRALRLGAVAREELLHRHATLELDLVHRHRGLPWVDGSSIGPYWLKS
jgi:hypothetical protein